MNITPYDILDFNTFPFQLMGSRKHASRQYVDLGNPDWDYYIAYSDKVWKYLDSRGLTIGANDAYIDTMSNAVYTHESPNIKIHVQLIRPEWMGAKAWVETFWNTLSGQEVNIYSCSKDVRNATYQSLVTTVTESAHNYANKNILF